MNLVFLHGRPATGKLTIARKLVTLTGYQLYHHHIAADEALQLYAFGSPGFIQRREQLWREFFIRAAKQLPPGVIYTFSPERSVPQSFIDWLFGEWSAFGIRLLSVELLASETAIEARLGASQRKHFKKITELSVYRELRTRGAFATPVIPRSDLQINTERNSADEAARQIVAQFKLNERIL
ncbi:MAG: hypothetical protein ABI273_12800 [Lacunisphaera sp.]